MKRIVAVFALVLIATTLQAQRSNVNKAERALDAGNLAEAIEMIEPATMDEKTKDDGRTWYTRGRIYASIATSENPEVQALVDQPLVKARESFEKVMELEDEGSNYYNLTGLYIDQTSGKFLNQGATFYQNEEMEKAIEMFDKVKMLKPMDTTAYLYAGIAAQSIQDFDALLENFNALIDMGTTNPDIYNSVIYYERTHNNDTVRAIEMARKAREMFPSSGDFRKQEVNMLIQTGKIDEARQGLEEAIVDEPGNANLLFNLGFLYEELGNTEKAIENYKKAIEVDPDYFDAVYNLGVFYYNRAADLYREANDLPLREYDTKGKAMEEEARESLRLSLPYMEDASELRPEVAVIWNTLSTIYTRLKMGEKAEAAFEKYEELTGN